VIFSDFRQFFHLGKEKTGIGKSVFSDFSLFLRQDICFNLTVAVYRKRCPTYPDK